MEAIAQQRARALLRVGSVALALLGALSAVAQDVEGDKRRASALLDEGNALFASRRYEAARSRYQAAYDAFPSPKILLNLAEVHRELGQPVRAIELYESFLSQASAVDPQHRERAEKQVAALEAQVGRIAIDGPTGRSILLDGKAVGALPLAPVRVAPGKHTVEASPFTEEVRVRAGQVATVRVPDEAPSLTPPIAAVGAADASGATPASEAASPALVATAPEPAESTSVVESWWFWTGVGVIVAGAAVVGVATAAGGDDFVPGGELGRVSTAGWTAFTPEGR